MILLNWIAQIIQQIRDMCLWNKRISNKSYSVLNQCRFYSEIGCNIHIQVSLNLLNDSYRPIGQKEQWLPSRIDDYGYITTHWEYNRDRSCARVIDY